MEPELAIVTRGVLWGAAGGAALGFGTCVVLLDGTGLGFGIVFGIPLGVAVGVINGLICAYALVLGEGWIDRRLARAEAVSSSATAATWFAVWTLCAGGGWGVILAVGGALALVATVLLTPTVALGRRARPTLLTGPSEAH